MIAASWFIMLCFTDTREKARADGETEVCYFYDRSSLVDGVMFDGQREKKARAHCETEVCNFL